MANNVKNETILVTGCAGFIGGNFVRAFRQKFPGAKIVGLDDLSTGRRDALDRAVVFYKGSVCDIKLLDEIFKKHAPKYVFHFAAMPQVPYSVQHPAETTYVNIYGTVLLLEKSRDHGVKRFIYSASSAAYGLAKKLPTKESENPPHPVSPYGLQKYTGEPFCEMFSALYGLDTVSLRYFNVFGPGQYGGSSYATVVCNWLEGLYFPKKDAKPFLDGDGRQSRDFCYVANVVDANIKAMQTKKKLKGEVFNIAYGERTDLRTVQRLIERYTGRKLHLEKHPPRLGDVKHTHADVSKAKKILGYAPKVDFAEGLKRTIAWFDERCAYTGR